jgi:hypothetical protein
MEDDIEKQKENTLYKIFKYYKQGKINSDECMKWQGYAIDGLLNEKDIDNAIYKRANGYPYFTFCFIDPNMRAIQEC